MADDDSSDLSSISSLSAPPSDDESDIQLQKEHGILKFFHKVDKNPALEPKEPSPPPRKREPSPPHEYVLADNPDIAVRISAVNRVVVAPGHESSRVGVLSLQQSPKSSDATNPAIHQDHRHSDLQFCSSL